MVVVVWYWVRIGKTIKGEEGYSEESVRIEKEDR
jgi:hypothetical protein